MGPSTALEVVLPTAAGGCAKIEVPLTWIAAFLAREQGDLERKFRLDQYLGRGRSLRITTDASPWGLGAVLETDGVIVSYLFDKVEHTDREVLGLSCDGDSCDQQALEALAMLVALREWRAHWRRNIRVQVGVRSDNMATLAPVCKTQPHSGQLGIVARELALETSISSCAPHECEHIAGVANKAADALSRQFAPVDPPALPPYLDTVPRHACTPTQRSWWISIPH